MSEEVTAPEKEEEVREGGKKRSINFDFLNKILTNREGRGAQ